MIFTKTNKMNILLFMFSCVFILNIFPLDIMNNVCLPFNSINDRSFFNKIKARLLDGFGAYRTAGHKHAGLDIKGNFEEEVYAIGKGIVKAIYGEFPYSAVIIEHILSNNEIIYSVYTHLGNIEVNVNELIDYKTKLGRLFSEEEYKSSGFYQNHLHFEIRKTFERYKGISIKCFTIEELNKYFYNPEDFFKEKMKMK